MGGILNTLINDRFTQFFVMHASNKGIPSTIKIYFYTFLIHLTQTIETLNMYFSFKVVFMVLYDFIILNEWCQAGVGDAGCCLISILNNSNNNYKSRGKL